MGHHKLPARFLFADFYKLHFDINIKLIYCLSTNKQSYNTLCTEFYILLVWAFYLTLWSTVRDCVPHFGGQFS